MKAVLFQARRGEIVVEDVPPPQPAPGRVQIRNLYSLISAGTERSTLRAGRQGLVGKARERPDQAREVLRSMRVLGPLETYRLVDDRLSTPTLLGYSCAGRVVGLGPNVDDVAVGSLVAAGGGGHAGHAEVVSVPANLCVSVPTGVSATHAAFATVGAVALQGIHQANAVPGSRVAVIGLGLVGQLVGRLLLAYGYDVVGIDRDRAVLDVARAAGLVAIARDDDVEAEMRRRWNGAGADAVVVCASTRSADPVELAGVLARDRATVVIVGDARVAPPRTSYYGKELSIHYSRSYGPGRYDPCYERDGRTYPEGYVPWPLRRNMEEFLRLVANGLDLDSLSPAVFPLDRAADAYSLLDAGGAARRVAILLRYPEAEQPSGAPTDGAVVLRARPVQTTPTGTLRVAAAGAGSFPTRMLFPHLRRLPHVQFSWITSATGLTARHQGRRWGFDAAVATLEQGLARADADCVMVLGPHAVHARQVAEVLRHGVGVFCEKPLAISEEQLDEVVEAWLSSPAPAMVGFNRRFAPAVRDLKREMPPRGPVQLAYRVFAGPPRPGHWITDVRHGGRVVGEVCHFIDTASFLVGSTPSTVHAASADRRPDPAATQSVSIQLEFRDGSAASVLYCGQTPRRAPKELIEVAGHDFAARIDDFRSLTLWGKRKRRRTYRGRPKGHEAEMRALVALLHGARPSETDFVASIWSSLATCRVAESLRQHSPVPVAPSGPALRALLAAAPSPKEPSTLPRAGEGR